MTRRVLYMAHPVAPTADELAAIPTETVEIARGEYDKDLRWPIKEEVRVAASVRANIDSALRWLVWLRSSFPETTFIAPWIVGVQAVGGDGTPEDRERGLVDCCAVVERCDGIVLVGGRISSGIRREMEHGVASAVAAIDKDARGQFEAYDLAGYQPEGDAGRNTDKRTFIEWMDRYRESCTR